MTLASPLQPGDSKPGFPLSLVFLLGGLGTMGPLSVDMYLPALPTIGLELAQDPAGAQRSLAVYFAGLAIGGLAIGPISDHWGRRRPLIVGLLAYIVGSLGCALATTTSLLIVCRFLQALGGAAAMIIPRAVVRDQHTGAAAVRTMSMLMLVGAAAPIIAPLLGGLVLSHLGWRSIFLILSGVGCMLLVGTVALVGGTAQAQRSADRGTGHLRALLTERTYVAYTVGGALGGASMFAYISGSPYVFITIHGVSPGRFGWFFGANALALVSAAQLARLLMRWSRPAVVAQRAACGAAAAGVLLVTCAYLQIGGVWGVSIPLILLLGCLGLLGPTAGVMALEAHGARAGLAAAVASSLGFTLAAGASAVVDALHNGTSLPMAGTVASFAVASAAVISLAPGNHTKHHSYPDADGRVHSMHVRQS